MRERYAMGRHAADRPAPGSLGPSPTRPPSHSDLFTPPRPLGTDDRVAAATFDMLVAPHRAALRACVLRLTDGDEEAAESALKETYYRAARDPARYPQWAASVRPWLVLLARTVLRDGERHEPAGHDDRPATAAPGSGRPGRPAPTVLQALDGLAAVHRDVLVELFYRGVSLEDAAEQRGLPVETIKSRLYFALRALRIMLDQQIPDR